jgi:hypothetical protein
VANESQIARLLEIEERSLVLRRELDELQEAAGRVMHLHKDHCAVSDFVAGGSSLKVFLERIGHSGHFS